MESKTFLARSMIVLSICLLVILVGSPATAKVEEAVALHGEIEAAEYDGDGNVVSVAVYDSEWGSVLISKEGKGKELLKHVGAIATVEGKIVESEDDPEYSYSIKVSGYKIEDSADRSWDDEDE